jgi:hypothetical protein
MLLTFPSSCRDGSWVAGTVKLKCKAPRSGYSSPVGSDDSCSPPKRGRTGCNPFSDGNPVFATLQMPHARPY